VTGESERFHLTFTVYYITLQRLLRLGVDATDGPNAKVCVGGGATAVGWRAVTRAAVARRRFTSASMQQHSAAFGLLGVCARSCEQCSASSNI
jgi:hypothetical protein